MNHLCDELKYLNGPGSFAPDFGSSPPANSKLSSMPHRSDRALQAYENRRIGAACHSEQFPLCRLGKGRWGSTEYH